jgi:hypothetical protein
LDRLSAQIKGVKSHTVSEDGATVSVVLDAKYVGELALLLSLEGLTDLVSVLGRAKAEIEAKAPTGTGPAGSDRPAAQRVAIQPPSQTDATQPTAAPMVQSSQVKISVPKNWLVSAETKVHDVVLLVFNHQTDAQTGYALDPNAAKKMAVGLVKNADAVLTNKSNRKPPDSPVGRQ